MVDTRDVDGYVIFWLLYMLLCAYIVLSLIVALVLDHFAGSFQNAACLLSERDYERLRESWGKVDPRASGEIPMKLLPALRLCPYFVFSLLFCWMVCFLTLRPSFGVFTFIHIYTLLSVQRWSAARCPRDHDAVTDAGADVDPRCP
jgi:hypothetical protein